MKAILRILLLFISIWGAADANAQTSAPALSGNHQRQTDESVKAALPGTYVILFREDHQEIIEIDGPLLQRIEEVRRAADVVYLKVNENILVKVLTPNTPAPVVGEDNFIYITNTEFDELLQESVL